jgi:hypothetical protein
MIDERDIWIPPARSKKTGHRISIDPGWRPIATHSLNWRWWLAEYPMRWLARSMSKDTNIAHLSGEQPRE